jgi:alpha-tubulin suppressor-like RCC1 family protein
MNEVPLGVVDVSCGLFHSAVLTRSGQVYLCGRNDFGQLGLGKEQEGVSMVDALQPARIRDSVCDHNIKQGENMCQIFE